VIPPTDLIALKNVQTITQQNYVSQAKAIKQHNIAVSLL